MGRTKRRRDVKRGPVESGANERYNTREGQLIKAGKKTTAYSNDVSESHTEII